MSPLEVAIFVSVIALLVLRSPSTSRRRQHGRSGELTRGWSAAEVRTGARRLTLSAIILLH